MESVEIVLAMLLAVAASGYLVRARSPRARPPRGAGGPARGGRGGGGVDATEPRLGRRDALKAKVERRAEEIRAEFQRNYMNERMAGAALGFVSWEAGRRLRELVEYGLLRPFDAPHEPTIVMSMDGWREGEGPSPLWWEGPFFLREEILALRRGAAEVAHETLAQAPAPVRAEARATPTTELSAEYLRWLAEQVTQLQQGKGGDR